MTDDLLKLESVLTQVTSSSSTLLVCKRIRGRLQRTSGEWGGGGFESSDIPGRGEGWFVKVQTSENF